MKRFSKLLFSSPTTVFLLLMLMFAMGTATFIEDKFDTITAYNLVYHSLWFELIFLLLILNLFGHLSKFNMTSRKKWPGLVFHLAFIVIIIGAGITRYFGFEGSMHIREGEETNLIYTHDPFLQISSPGKNDQFSYDKPFNISSFNDNSLHLEYLSPESGKVTIDYEAFLENAVERIKEHVPGGSKLISLIIADETAQQTLFLKESQVSNVGMFFMAFNNPANANAVQISEIPGGLAFTAPFNVIRTNMNTNESDTIRAGTQTEFVQSLIYRTQGMAFMNNGYFMNATTEFVPGSSDEKGTDALIPVSYTHLTLPTIYSV